MMPFIDLLNHGGGCVDSSTPQKHALRAGRALKAGHPLLTNKLISLISRKITVLASLLMISNPIKTFNLINGPATPRRGTAVLIC